MFYIYLIIIAITKLTINNNNNNNLNYINLNNIYNNNNIFINNKCISSFFFSNYFITYSSIDDLPKNINISSYFNDLTSIFLSNFEESPLSSLLSYNSSISYNLSDQNSLNPKYINIPFLISSSYNESEKNYLNDNYNEATFNYFKDTNVNYPNVTQKILTSSLTYKELSSKDLTNFLTQSQINYLLQKKYDIIKYIPFRLNSSYESGYLESLFNLYYFYNRKIPFYNESKDFIPSICSNRIDVVWTYVNGKEKKFKILFNKFFNKSDFQKNRFHDYDSLRFSMRSVYKYLPYAKHWFIVVQDENQIPKFLNIKKISNNLYITKNTNKNNERFIHIVFHKDIFPNKNFLPNFNSNAIESSLAFIKDLSECFLYLNDDFFIYSYLSPTFFIQPNGKINLYKQHIFTPNINIKSKWQTSIYVTNNLINEIFGFKRRLYPLHNLYFFRKSILQELNYKFKTEIGLTRFNKLRTIKDLVIPFLFSFYCEETGRGENIFFNRRWDYYNNILDKKSILSLIQTLYDYKNLKCFCLNDDTKDFNQTKINEFRMYLDYVFNEKLPFEIPYESSFLTFFKRIKVWFNLKFKQREFYL